jgi:hypothetical protein
MLLYAMRLTMQTIETQKYASQWLETHGDKAVVVAPKELVHLKKTEIAKRLRLGGKLKPQSS